MPAVPCDNAADNNAVYCHDLHRAGRCGVVAYMDEGGWLAGGAVDSALSRKVSLQQRKAHCRGLLRQ